MNWIMIGVAIALVINADSTLGVNGVFSGAQVATEGIIFICLIGMIIFFKGGVAIFLLLNYYLSPFCSNKIPFTETDIEIGAQQFYNVEVYFDSKPG